MSKASYTRRKWFKMYQKDTDMLHAFLYKLDVISFNTYHDFSSLIQDAYYKFLQEGFRKRERILEQRHNKRGPSVIKPTKHRKF